MFFRVVIIQSKAKESNQMASDWTKSTKEYELITSGHTFGLLATTGFECKMKTDAKKITGLSCKIGNSA